MAFECFLFVFSTMWEITEDIYLFVESHFDTQRDFEKIDDFLNFAIVYGIKLLCSAVFVACLTLWTWYNSPLKPSSRRDLEAEIVDALDTIQRLVTRNSELQARFDKTLEDHNSTGRDYGLLATEKIILENKLARLQLQPDLQEKCWELESSLDESQARCLDLETSLARSKRLRSDEDSERKALSMEAKQAKSELEKIKAKMQRDKAITAVPTSVSQLHKEKTLLQATLETQKAKFEAQLAEQSQRIHQQNLDLRSARLDFEDLETQFEELAALEQPDEARIAGTKKIEDEEAERGRGRRPRSKNPAG
ncbi:hypothetical protein MMC22_008909 [Lobaria immixta]|nr:hypothetical protein [Lobaria immixta]